MRALGRAGGRARRKGLAEQLPEAERQSLREYLRESLDHETIKGAVEQALAGGNESARVACIRFLSDLELYRRDGGECPRCQAYAYVDMPAVRAKLTLLLANEAAQATNADVERRAEELAQQRLQALKQEHGIA